MDQAIETKTLPSVCPLDCPDTCSLSVEVQGGKLLSVKGSRANPYTDGKLCAKVIRYYPGFVHGDKRLTHPLKRVGPRGDGTYVRITWDEALGYIYTGFSKAIARHGPQSIVPFNYAGPHGELAGGSMDRRFFYTLGATLLNRGPLCGAVRGGAYASLFGNAPGMPPEQAAHSDLILVWGNNVSVSNLHLMKVINKARKGGAKLVVIDPKRTKIAEQSDLFLQIHPGSDVVLAMALAAEFERRGALGTAFIREWVDGFSPYMEAARGYTLQDVVEKCRISEADFHALAELYTQAKNAAASFGNGIERTRSGGSGLRAAMALQALTGNHGRLGAGVIAKSGVATPKTANKLQRSGLIKPDTRTFNIVDVPEKILDETLDIPVKAMMIFNHNPVATHPDQSNMINALMRDDLFLVGADIAMTDSMALCDIILPAASHFEHDDVFGSYGHNYLQRSAPVIAPVGEALPNTEIFRRLAARFGFDDPILTASDADLINDAIDGNHPQLAGIKPSEMSLDKAIEMRATNGEPLIMCKNVHPATASGKIELFSQDLESRFGFGLPRYYPATQSMPFVLITPSSAKRTNATFGGCEASQGAEQLEVNPEDAKARGLTDGQKVIVWNGQAEVSFTLAITDATRPGVLYSPKGTWRVTSETGLTANALIPSDIRTDIERGACYNETFVDMRSA
ncbi:MAG: molybdopterin-dependent oxidoreductase [Rhodobacteraceae bacterium]|nr:molybdopterin-dependent oxidoreductase [Paracoccaceae bacterium]